MWMPRSCSSYDMGGASTPYALVRAVLRRLRLDGAVVADGHPGAAPRGAAAAQLDEPGHPVAVPGVGGEEFEHAGVVGLAAGQRPADHAGQVVVAHGDRVRVAHGPLPDLGGGPYADAGQREQ